MSRRLSLRTLVKGAALCALLLAMMLFAAWRTRSSWVTGMMVLAPSTHPHRMIAPDGVVETVEVHRAGSVIRAWMFEPVGPPRGTLVMLHGIRDTKRNLVPGALRHASRGWRVLAVDSRGHGESTGRYLTYGVEESRDLVALVDQLDARALLARPLAVVGTSYGAATALQFAARDPRVERLVAFAPFASLRAVVPAYVSWILGWPGRLVPAPVLDQLIDDSARTAGFDPDLACPRCSASQIRAAVLLVHCRDDERIPWQHSVAIRAALKAPSRLMLLERGGHLGVADSPGVQGATDRWLDGGPD